MWKDTPYRTCIAEIPGWKELEHYNANHKSDNESSGSEEKEKSTRRQKKKKTKRNNSSTESESEDYKVKRVEWDKLAKGISSNTNAVDDLSTSIMKNIKGIKSDLNGVDKLSEKNMRHVSSLTQIKNKKTEILIIKRFRL